MMRIRELGGLAGMGGEVLDHVGHLGRVTAQDDPLLLIPTATREAGTIVVSRVIAPFLQCSGPRFGTDRSICKA